MKQGNILMFKPKKIERLLENISNKRLNLDIDYKNHISYLSPLKIDYL